MTPKKPVLVESLTKEERQGGENCHPILFLLFYIILSFVDFL
jgi:hypothetical protein